MSVAVGGVRGDPISGAPTSGGSYQNFEVFFITTSGDTQACLNKGTTLKLDATHTATHQISLAAVGSAGQATTGTLNLMFTDGGRISDGFSAPACALSDSRPSLSITCH